MSVKKDEKVAEPVETIKQTCIKCIKGANLIKTIVVMVCVAVVCDQIISSIRKLTNIPITTYTHFDFNQTILYPSLTFCREPPYKFDKLQEYGLTFHPRYTSSWRNFNFSGVPLDFLWNEITYDTDDFFVQYGIDGLPENVEVSSTLGFVLGRCHTLTSKNHSTRATRESGYSITLKHNATDIATSTSVYPPGYHVYVHYHREPFTEVEVYNGGIVDYMYINTGDTITAKLTVDEYVKISDEDEPCINRENYSANACTEQVVWDDVGYEAGCSGPWMISDLPHCSNFTSMRTLISTYMNMYLDHSSTICPRSCRSYMYNAYVTNRQAGQSWDTTTRQWYTVTGNAALQMQLYLNFNTMMVSVHEERYNYDWNLFVSDLGGSIGFLLGLSVVGLLTIASKVWSTVIRPSFRRFKNKDSIGIITTSTTDVKTISKNDDYLKKCNNWNTNNDLPNI